MEKERRRELRPGGGRRRRGGESGGDERNVEALAVDMSDRESEPRQAIVGEFGRNANCERGFDKGFWE